VVLDGRMLATSTSGFQFRLSSHLLGGGRHRVQVLATDLDGQAALTQPSIMRVDGQPPEVAIRSSRRGRAVRVRISDAGSGVSKHTIRISFGDGHGARGRARIIYHYRRAGVYQVSVSATDRLGNRGVVRELVSVR
jgi:hypothetical protein